MSVRVLFFERRLGMRPMETLVRLLARVAGGAIVAILVATYAMAADEYERPEPDDARFPARESAYGELKDSGYTVKMQSEKWFPQPARCSIQVAIEDDYIDSPTWLRKLRTPDTKITDLEVGFERQGRHDSNVYHAFFRMRIVRLADGKPLAVERLVFVFQPFGSAPNKTTAHWVQHPIDAAGFAGVSIDMNKLSQAELQQFIVSTNLSSLRFAFDLPELNKSLAYFTPNGASGGSAADAFAPCVCSIGHPGLAKNGWLECAKYSGR
jgi:hypothetical protein